MKQIIIIITTIIIIIIIHLRGLLGHFGLHQRSGIVGLSEAIEKDNTMG
jgi:uncharacterized protein YxeA